MLKCPYCYEKLEQEEDRCPHCDQFIIDDIVDVSYPSIEKKDCLFCGKHILRESKICRHCHKWFDEVNQAVLDIDPDDLV